MPTLKRINAEAGTNFRRTTELVAALRSPMQHYQVKVTEYGQVCLRAPDYPQAVGLLWRVNEHGLRSGGGHFGQAVLFPARMRPGQNSNIDYRLPQGGGFNYYTGDIPEITQEWQWIDGYPVAPYDSFWHDMDDLTEIPVSEYDGWLLTGEPMPGTVAEEAPDLEAQEAERVAREEAFRRQVEEENRRHDERMDRERAEAEALEIKAAQDREDERLRREREDAEEERRRQREAEGIVEYPLLDQMRDGLADKTDAEVHATLAAILSHGGNFEEAARAYAKERGLTL